MAKTELLSISGINLHWICSHNYKIPCSNCVRCERFFCFFRVYCLIGDGESAEGSIWEALHFASYYKLDNLCVILDVNRLGQSEPTSLQHNMDVYWKRLDAFGCNAILVDGHNVEELCKVLFVHACLDFIGICMEQAREVCWSTYMTVSVTRNQI